MLDALLEALPDALAAVTCLVAIAQPDWPGYDLLRTAGLLFFFELPIAVVILGSGVLRLDEAEMSFAEKCNFVLAPIVVLVLGAAFVSGVPGFVAMGWLSAAPLYALATGRQPGGRLIPGFVLEYQRRDGEISVGMRLSGEPDRGEGVWQVQGGVEQYYAGLTILIWTFVATIVWLFHLPAGGATADYAASVLWKSSVIGAVVRPEQALWAGAMLFGIRTLLKLDFGAGEADSASQ